MSGSSGNLALDYDDVDYMEVYEDAVSNIFHEHFYDEKAVLRIYRSSPRHYHVVITAEKHRTFQELIAIARKSCSSQGYIDRAEKVGYFMLRSTGKADGKPAPELVLEIR